MSSIFYAGMIPFYLNRACGAAWCSHSDFDTGFTSCDFWTEWAECPAFYPHPDIDAGSAPFTEGTNPNNGHTGLVAECAFANYPTPIFQVSTMVRTTPMADGGTGQYIAVGVENLYQLMGDALNFRCVIEISNHVTPGSEQRRSATFRIDSQGPTISVATYGIDADGFIADFQSTVISPIIPAPELVSLTLELDSYTNGLEEVIVNGGLAHSTTRGTDIGESGGYQAVTMWWDVQFALCSDGDATSPVITQADGGEICDYSPPIGGGCLSVMGAATGWRRMDADPDTYLMFWDSTNHWYRESDGVAQWQELQWETSIAGNQSIEIAVENVGSHSGAVGVVVRQQGVQGYWRDTGIEAEVYADGDGAHSLYVANASASLYYFADDAGFGAPTSYTLRMESDVGGGVRVYVDNVLMYSGLDPDGPYAAGTNVGVVMDAFPPVGTSPPYDFSTSSPRITDICIRTDACIPEVMGSARWIPQTTPASAPLTFDAFDADYYPPTNSFAGLLWPDEFSNTQSIEVSITDYGTTATTDYTAIECRRIDTDEFGGGLRFATFKYTDPVDGELWQWYVEYCNSQGDCVFEADPPGPPDFPSGDFFWPYGFTHTQRLESDANGDYRVYINGVLLTSGNVPGIPLGPSKMGLWGDRTVDDGNRPAFGEICMIGT